MKIICKDKAEYDKLMEASRYLHDFVVWDENGDGQSLDMEKYEIVNFLCGVYLGNEDFPTKDKYIFVEKEDDLSK